MYTYVIVDLAESFVSSQRSRRTLPAEPWQDPRTQRQIGNLTWPKFGTREHQGTLLMQR